LISLAIDYLPQEADMIAILQLFFGIALGYAGIGMMNGSFTALVIGIAACFFSLILVLEGATRLIYWLARLKSPGPT
jgi:hypothetical protein